MLLKALLLICVLHGVESGYWVKIASDACVGSRGNHFKDIEYSYQTSFIGAVKLVHYKGKVGCHGAARSFWGCAAHGTDINMYVTDLNNQVIYPSKRLVPARTGGWYKLPGYTSSSPELVFTDFGHPRFFTHGQKLRLWYGEDLCNFTEGDNHGFTCLDLWVYVLPIVTVEKLD